jgi:hypothetical protein
VIVIGQIGDQKERGGHKGGYHARPVGGDLSPSDEEISDGKQESAGAIQCGIEGRER